mmetsp:Transcript_31056/g.63019  ORF Transcript_31056/g.63019 Transcript_31056/m.63019 type:complete len:86 (+) Transcript_31056:91-348(+)
MCETIEWLVKGDAVEASNDNEGITEEDKAWGMSAGTIGGACCCFCWRRVASVVARVALETCIFDLVLTEAVRTMRECSNNLWMQR